MSTTVSDPSIRAEIGVIGGSGFYSFLPDAVSVQVETPFGPPSSDLHIGEVDGRKVAFLARHGVKHQFPPHALNYRANLWALRAIGVRQVLGPCAVGSLVRENGMGTIVLPDQIIDRTWGRAHTVYAEPGRVVHVPFADPYCPRGRSAVLDATAAVEDRVVDGGTLVVINGPRFSTRAESVWHQQAGATVVGMTGMPEASIARELALCYTSICLVTDLDAGVSADESVTYEMVIQAFNENMGRFKQLIAAVIPRLPSDLGDDHDDRCSCRRSVDGLRLPFELP